MNITITKDLKRKTHTPSGTKGKTLCGKRIASSVPVTTDRPGCKVCAVVYDQSLRGVMRNVNAKSKEEREKSFAEGMVFALIQMVHEDRSCIQTAKSVFDAAGLTEQDFRETGGEYDRIALNLILEKE